MRLKEIVAPKAILPDLKAAERDGVITELIDAIIRAGAADATIRDDLIARVLQREAAGSTGFGRGVAVPHVKHSEASRMAAAIGLSRTGVDFNSLDKQPVYSVVLLVSPLDRPEEHLQAMEVIFKNLSKDTFRRFLRQAETVEDVLSLLDEADNQQLGA